MLDLTLIKSRSERLLLLRRCRRIDHTAVGHGVYGLTWISHDTLWTGVLERIFGNAVQSVHST